MNKKKVKMVVRRVFSVSVFVIIGYLLVSLAGIIYQNRPQLEEHTWQGYINWGDNLAYYGDYELAIKAVETAISKEPQNPEGYAFLANVYLRNRDIESAKAVYAEAADKIGQDELFDEGVEEILNIDLPVDPLKSVVVSEMSEDTPKYDTTWKYNSNGDVVHTFARSRDWKKPDVETFYEYNSDNQLLKITEISSYSVPYYTTYEYHSNGQVKVETNCDFDGYILNKKVYDEAGVKLYSEVHSLDRSYYVETFNADQYIVKKDFYNTDKQLEYYAEYEETENEEYQEKTTYYNPDNTLKYTILHTYSSTVKSVKRETYLNADGSVAYIIDYGKDKMYHLYTDSESDYTDGNEYPSYKFYDEIEAYVYQQLDIKE